MRSAAFCACAAARPTMRVSFWSAFSQPAMYEVDSVSVAASMPQCPQRNAAPISATSSSRLYSCDPKRIAFVIPFRPRRDSCPVLCVLCRRRHKRHTTASLLLNAGVDPFAVQRILRHTDPRITTEVYGHLVPGYLRDAINKLPLAGAADLLPTKTHSAEEAPFGPPRWSGRCLPQKQRPDRLRKTSARSGLLIGCGGRI